jgi:phosphate starvation-inducible PhoH-like protein
MQEPPEAISSLSQKARKRQARKQAKRASDQPSNALVPRNKAQGELLQALRNRPVVFALGPAGVGKTYIPARFAIQQLLRMDSPIKKIVVARPTAAPSRHRLGFLPGNGNAKMRPWLVPIWDGFKAETSTQNLDKLMQAGQIEVVPFEHMQGRTFDDAVILLDEAENALIADLKMIITRTGEGSTLVISGDPEQAVIDGVSGLVPVAAMVRRYGLNAAVVKFSDADVTRSPVVAEWVKAFRKQEAFGGPLAVIENHA